MAVLMRAGDLRHRVELQVRTLSTDDFGETIETWQTQETVWAAVEPLTGMRYLAAKQANADVTGTVRMRYREGVRPTMRLLWGTRVLRIVSIINPDERSRELHILYKETLD